MRKKKPDQKLQGPYKYIEKKFTKHVATANIWRRDPQPPTPDYMPPMNKSRHLGCVVTFFPAFLPKLRKPWTLDCPKPQILLWLFPYIYMVMPWKISLLEASKLCFSWSRDRAVRVRSRSDCISVGCGMTVSQKAIGQRAIGQRAVGWGAIGQRTIGLALGTFCRVHQWNLHPAHINCRPRRSPTSLPATLTGLFVRGKVKWDKEQEVGAEDAHARKGGKLFTGAFSIARHLREVSRGEVCVRSKVDEAYIHN